MIVHKAQTHGAGQLKIAEAMYTCVFAKSNVRLYKV